MAENWKDMSHNRIEKEVQFTGMYKAGVIFWLFVMKQR